MLIVNLLKWTFLTFSLIFPSHLRKKEKRGKRKTCTTIDQRFGANLNNVFFCKILLQISCFLAFCHKKHWKWLFHPAFGVRSTQTLREIYNNCLFCDQTNPILFKVFWIRNKVPGHFKLKGIQILKNQKLDFLLFWFLDYNTK